MSHQSLINEKSEPIPAHPPTFPARPIRGGKLELAPKKSGIWFAEPKYNGWRALVHTPTGAMWNRHGQRLTIEREFAKALAALRALAESGLVWADCEALERRHQIGRGSLVVLDWIPDSGSPTYEELKIKGDLIPEAAAEEIIGELQALFARHNAGAALSAKAVFKPTKEFHTARHTLYSAEENMEIDKVVPVAASVKTKLGRGGEE